MQFSIVITSFNQPDYLKEAIESVFNQTYKKPFECIIINDSSEKSCITLDLADSRPEINLIYIENEKNLGLQKAYNIGCFYASGEWIIRLDGDDKLLSETLEILETKINELNDNKIAFLYSDLKIMGTDNIRVYPDWTSQSIYDLCNIGHLQIVRRNFSEEIGHWDISLKYSADTDFIIRLIEAGYKIKHVSDVLVENRLHPEQYTQTFVKDGNDPNKWKKFIFDRALNKRPDLWLESYQNVIMQTAGSALWRSEANFVYEQVVGLANGIDLGCSYRKKYPFAIGIDMDRQKGKVPDMIWNVEEEIPFRDGTLDYIIASHIVEHLKNPVETLQNWIKKLKVDGLLVLIIPDKRYIPNIGTPNADPTHKHDWNPVDFKTNILEKLINSDIPLRLLSYNKINNNWSFDCVLRKLNQKDNLDTGTFLIRGNNNE